MLYFVTRIRYAQVLTLKIRMFYFITSVERKYRKSSELVS